MTLNVSAQKIHQIQKGFNAASPPPAPHYAERSSWAALPEMKDFADFVPKNSKMKDEQMQAKADVFFIHPTIYVGIPKGEFLWNADVNDQEMNRSVDETTILNQATAFNGGGKVYAPRYRQAHYSAFTSSDKESCAKALDLAYSDVKEAFQYYLNHYNNGRPIVIAAHSQGTVHAIRLLKEFFDGKPLQNQLVEAYLIGMPVKADEFEHIKASNGPAEFGGFVTWNTFARGYFPSYYENGLNRAICTNPLTWKTNDVYASRKLNLGGVGMKYKFVKKPVDAQVMEGILWINKPHIPGRMFLKTKIWHKADINLYWMNIRENVTLRTSSFLSE